MDEKTVSFEEKLTGLLDLAKKKKNVLENREILDYFRGEILGPDKLDKIYDYLEKNQIDVLQTEEEEIDEELFMEEGMDEEEEIDMEHIDLSVPEGISLEDPVRMYLKEIGKIPLLSTDAEIALAKRMERAIKKLENVWQRLICAW